MSLAINAPGRGGGGPTAEGALSGFGGLWSQYSLLLVLIFLLIVPIIVLLTIVLASKAAGRGRWEGGWEAKLWSQSAGANSVVLLRQPAQCTLHTSTSRIFSHTLLQSLFCIYLQPCNKNHVLLQLLHCLSSPPSVPSLLLLLLLQLGLLLL